MNSEHSIDQTKQLYILGNPDYRQTKAELQIN